MLKNFAPRLYQQLIFAKASLKNTLVVLPTGLGKTAISMMLIAHRLTLYPKSKAMILAPTKPLVDQHVKTLRSFLDLKEGDLALFTGHVSPKKREELWASARIIVSTPQGLANDLISSRLSLEDVSVITFDECHRAVGEYAYVWIAKQYQGAARYPRILALTASPGSELEKINEVLDNLFIEEIEIRTETDPDVKPYVQEVDIVWLSVAFPNELKNVQQYFKACYQSKLAEISKYGYLSRNEIQNESKTLMLQLQGTLQGELASGGKDPAVLKSLSLAAEALKVQHAIELLETQGLLPLRKYLAQLEEQAKTSSVKAVQNLVRDSNFRSGLVATEVLLEKNITHPKLERLKELTGELMKKYSDAKLIIFTQYRDSGSVIVETLGQIEGVHPKLFVGQAKKQGSGLSQKEQLAMLDGFRKGEFNILVSSSVGEEGLDIPQVDAVIFYEPIPSAIRHIQRKGRTGRLEKGAVYILCTEGTRDVGYRWSSHHKEKRMYRLLDEIKRKRITTVRSLQSQVSNQPTLASYLSGQAPPPAVTIYVDHRERSSTLLKELREQGVLLKLEQLSCADYVLGKRCAVEFKTQEDFIESLIDGRLLSQVQLLKERFKRPLILVEGDVDLYSIRNVHPNAIRGLLASITIDFGIPILTTKNPKETAALLFAIAKREQERYGKEFSIHGDRKPQTPKEQQEFVVSALPGIGRTLAKPLLQKFGSIKKLVNSSEEELRSVEKIGEVKAKQMKELFEREYEDK